MIYTVILKTLNLFGSHLEYDTLLLVDLVHVQGSVAKIICLFTAVAFLSDACKPVIKNRLDLISNQRIQRLDNNSQ